MLINDNSPDSAEHAPEETLQEQVDRQAKIIQAQQKTIDQLENHLDEIVNSKVWRGAESIRRIYRVHIFAWFPSLQLTLLPALRRRYRKYVILPLVRLGLCKGEYEQWLEVEQAIYQKLDEQVARQVDAFSIKPLISLVMPVYNVRPDWLRKAVDSVKAQSYKHWQLCIADDCSTDQRLLGVLKELAEGDERIAIRFLETNQGIAGASNAALELAQGDYVGFLDNDDELAPHALLAMAKAINREPEADLLYSDEDKITEKGRRYAPFFKPDWSPDTLRSYNYLCHFTVIRKTLLDTVGGFRVGYDGSQDYDLFLRATEQAWRIIHIPEILYHWRAIEGSVGKRGDAKMYAYDSARRALQGHLERTGLPGEVTDGNFLGSYHIRYTLSDQPKITIIIPTKDKVDVLRRCVSSIIERSTYQNIEIVIVDNGSIEQATAEYYASLQGNRNIRLLEYDQPFNFSAINNYAVSQVDAEYLLFLNNDTEVLSPGWLEEMLGFGQRKDVGAVGNLLYYPNDTVQHGGIIIGIGGVAGHSHKYFPRNEYGYFGRLKSVQNLSAVTAACLLTRQHVYEEVGGFEEDLSHAFNDVDLCLKIREKGYLVVYTPFSELYHHESISRGYENTPEKMQRFKQERRFVEERWASFLRQGDPYYSPHLSLISEDFALDRAGRLESLITDTASPKSVKTV